MERRIFSVVPAAGRSRRMGRAKLLLPWKTLDRPDGNVIDSVLAAWSTDRVVATVVVIRGDDPLLEAACSRWPVHVVRATPAPEDMKASIQLGLRYLDAEFTPQQSDYCFFCPADVPELRRHIIHRLIDEVPSKPDDKLLVPRFGKKTGHPVLFPWSSIQAIFSLAPHEGLNVLTGQHGRRLVNFESAEALQDIDTPEEYEERLRKSRRS